VQKISQLNRNFLASKKLTNHTSQKSKISDDCQELEIPEALVCGKLFRVFLISQRVFDINKLKKN